MSEFMPAAVMPADLDRSSLDHAVRVGFAKGNQLLVDYCVDFSNSQGLSTNGIPPYNFPSLRWLDTALTPDDSQLSREQVLRGKIQRTLWQIQQLEDGGYMGYTAVPAFNEADKIPALIKSVKEQVVDIPVALVVADNNSTDATSEVVQELGGEPVVATKQGIGAARQEVLNRILRDTVARPDRTIIMQTDADTTAYPGYWSAAVEAFRDNRAMQVGVGPSCYTIPTQNGRVLEIVGGKAYGQLLGTKGVRQYFETYNRQPDDYLLEGPYRYLAGPNTTFRASLFTDHQLSYPADGRWESLDLALRIQRVLPSSTTIRYVEGQHAEVSPRAVLGEDDVLTAQRLNAIREAGYVGTYTKKSDNHTPFTTVEALLKEFDAQTYGLSADQRVVGVVEQNHPMAAVYETRQAIHAGTGRALLGKVALIANYVA